MLFMNPLLLMDDGQSRRPIDQPDHLSCRRVWMYRMSGEVPAYTMLTTRRFCTWLSVGKMHASCTLTAEKYRIHEQFC